MCCAIVSCHHALSYTTSASSSTSSLKYLLRKPGVLRSTLLPRILDSSCSKRKNCRPTLFRGSNPDNTSMSFLALVLPLLSDADNQHQGSIALEYILSLHLSGIALKNGSSHIYLVSLPILLPSRLLDLSRLLAFLSTNARLFGSSLDCSFPRSQPAVF